VFGNKTRSDEIVLDMGSGQVSAQLHSKVVTLPIEIVDCHVSYLLEFSRSPVSNGVITITDR